MIFTAMVREIILGSFNFCDARLEGITDHGSPYTIGNGNSTTTKMTLNDEWSTPPIDFGGGHLVIVNAGNITESGGLILSGNSLPYEQLTDTLGNPLFSGGNKIYYSYVRDGGGAIIDYREYTSFNSVVHEVVYQLNGAGEGAGPVGTDAFDHGAVLTNFWSIYLAVPLLNQLPPLTQFVVFRQNEHTNPSINDNAIDLRQYISNITWSTSIDKGFDTATVELNESASNLGKYYSYMLGMNMEIIDIYGNRCWNGIITSIYIDGGGGRIDAVGYKQTFSWFRFDRIYAMPEAGWDGTNRGPTSSQVLNDCMLMNPYMRRFYLDIDDPAGTGTHWGLKGFTDGIGDSSHNKSWPRAQLTETANRGLDELDFSDGSFKCSDAISVVESFGYAYPNEGTDQPSKDTMYLQCWFDGYAKIQRIKKEPATLVPDYVITNKNIGSHNRGIEVSGDINNIVTETYVLYSSEDGESQVSSSTYNLNLMKVYGVRTRIETSDFGPDLASLIASASRADKNLVVGVGNVEISGNVKGGGGAMYNLPCYMMRAGRVVEFESSIGYSSLYRNQTGTPGIFYIGSTSFSTSTGKMTITPATTLSAVDLFITQQSSIVN